MSLFDLRVFAAFNPHDGLIKMISNIASTTIVLSWIFTAISIVSIGLSIYHRKVVLRCFGVEDYMLVMASLATLVLVIQITWAIINEGQDKHLREISSTKLTFVLHVSHGRRSIHGCD